MPNIKHRAVGVSYRIQLRHRTCLRSGGMHHAQKERRSVLVKCAESATHWEDRKDWTVCGWGVVAGGQDQERTGNASGE